MSLQRISVLAIVATALGCSSADADGEAVAGPAAWVPYPGCESYSYEACDVLESACQENVVGLVHCLRGTQGTVIPPVMRMTIQEYREELEQSTAEVDHTWDRSVERGYGALGLLAPGSLDAKAWIENKTAHVGAFYRWRDAQIVMLVPDDPADRGDDREMETLIFAHEVVHALQDQEHGSQAWHEEHDSTFDSALGSLSVAEGEATLYETLLRAAFWGLPVEEIELDRRFDVFAERADEALLEDPSALLNARHRFPYAHGARYVSLRWAAAGQAGIEDLFATPPTSTHQILLSESEAVTEPAPDIPLMEPVALDGYALVSNATLGAYLLQLVLAKRGVPNAGVQRLVRDWRGDRLWVFGRADSPDVGVIWRFRLGSEQGALELAAELDRPIDGLKVSAVHSGRDITFVITESSELLIAWMEAAQGMERSKPGGYTVMPRPWWWSGDSP